jgi:hypothetical protein
MPKAMLTATAAEDASTPAAPFIPQNQGVGVRSTLLMKRMPVGKPKPIRTPAGAITTTQSGARTMRAALSKTWSAVGNQRGSAARYPAARSAHRTKRGRVSSGSLSEIKLPMPVVRMSENSTMLSE